MKDISTTVPKTNTKQEPTSKFGEALSAPKNTQTRKPKRHGETKNHSETQFKTSSIEKVDLSTLTTTGAAGRDTYTDKGNDVSATLETTPIYVQEAEDLWDKKRCEVIVAVQKSANNMTWRMSLRHKEFITLKPHNLLMGETIEYYMHATMNKSTSTNRLYILNHYTTEVILFKGIQEISRQSLKKENFENYDGAVGFVNVNENHWKFVFLHAMSEKIFVVDPADTSNDLKDSKGAAARFRQYFRTRFNLHGKRDWVNIRWKPSTIVHTVQEDATSCGVLVMQMAREVIEKFPAIPDQFIIDPSPINIVHLRKEMAKEILHSSESKEDYCSHCGSKELKSKINMVWIQCEQCQRWYHACCLGLSPDKIPGKHAQWLCSLCT
ncbi:uncharacterized protein LOC143746846 [Siphateles boraxobius]|uniref:uncharacterized protein LOC143746846 n=1 Tax=Siphateles boraxobius TaxID=180520 RepID=UPI0040638250